LGIKYISRLAPTPSGYLHLGNIYNFIKIRDLVRNSGGELWLRIDDCDRGRVKVEYIKDIFDTLNWLGISWDKGPKNFDDFEKNYSQILRSNYYFTRMSELSTYVCNCSRKEIKERGCESGYDGFCRKRQLTFVKGKSAIRFQSSKNDFILWTKDNHPSYQLVSVVDDLDMGINLIVRGDDLRESTVMQQELSQAFGKELAKTIFHELLTGPNSEKLSKSNSSWSIKEMRESGMKRNEILEMVGIK